MKAGLCKSHKLACISYSLFVFGVIFFDLIIFLYLLSIQVSQSTFTPWKLFSVTLPIVMAMSASTFKLLLGSESEKYDLLIDSDVSPMLILLTNLEIWTTFTLLAWQKLRWHSQICGLEFHSYMKQSFPCTNIALPMSISKTKRFLYLPTSPTLLPLYLRIMESGWS